MTKFAKICAVLLFVPVVILSVYMLRLTYLAHFEKVEIAVEGYDPKDFFPVIMSLCSRIGKKQIALSLRITLALKKSLPRFILFM